MYRSLPSLPPKNPICHVAALTAHLGQSTPVQPSGCTSPLVLVTRAWRQCWQGLGDPCISDLQRPHRVVSLPSRADGDQGRGNVKSLHTLYNTCQCRCPLPPQDNLSARPRRLTANKFWFSQKHSPAVQGLRRVCQAAAERGCSAVLLSQEHTCVSQQPRHAMADAPP